MKLEKLAEVQRKLATRIVERELDLAEVKRVGAVDVSYRDKKARTAFVLCSFPEGEPIRWRVVETDVTAPYVTTFFFLRETRPILLAVKGEDFDVLLVEGHGKAHPRGYGLASHVGLILGRPTIGVAKKPLKGAPEGSFRKVGKVYVSVGHLIVLEDAVRLVKALLEGGYPKPLKLADKLSKGWS
ncbi:endonuclease V [Pyrococcus yayanosii]|uniref:Endonuclease V n=1 Tax=Pyrococcus yayanosii (strain CH1 / JCM 16557) TaxID=529709 RepID=F8AEM7_PYRYC|nr:endonuclease V [Pyrococcus yayanosii]AEH24707.1 endonuclease V [Pyrococcus yayanosii CH1]